MAIVVEHEKRKKEILEKSLELFIAEGYEDVTYQKIADRCGITRTTLYIYFKNKREIFSFSIKQLTGDVERQLLEIIKQPELHSVDCLEGILSRHVLVWYVAIIAGGISAMRGVHPGGIIGRHDVAIDAGRRIIAKIGVRTKHIDCECATSQQCSKKHHAHRLLRAGHSPYELLRRAAQVLHLRKNGVEYHKQL